MSEARSVILDRIRDSLCRVGTVSPEMQDRLAARLRSRPRGIVPERARGDTAHLVRAFRGRAEQVDATTAEIASLAEVPEAVASFLSSNNVPAQLRMAPHPDLTGIDWSQRSMLTVSQGPSDGDDLVSVTRAFAGIAETGTIMLLAGRNAPTTLNFLPENHIVVLKRSEVVGSYEDAWDRLRDALGPDDILSRAVNLITGPSRTADIEQTLELGAHGPIRLHILIVADG